MADISIKQKAIELRKSGKTYSEIIIALNKKIPKGTLSSWFSGIHLDEEQADRIDQLRLNNLKQARIMALKVNAEKRKKYLESLLKNNQNIFQHCNNKTILKMLLAMLYLGEGAKWKSHRGLQLGNSDPNIIKIYLRLLSLCYDVSPSDLSSMIYHRVDQDLGQLISFWSQVTKIPKEKFYINKPDQRTKGKKTRKGYFGVCAIFGPGTKIQLELEAIAKLLIRI